MIQLPNTCTYQHMGRRSCNIVKDRLMFLFREVQVVRDSHTETADFIQPLSNP
jgi:hypothetical protein